jgi:hypothetical protein
VSEPYNVVLPVVGTIVADSETEAMARLAAALVAAGFDVYDPGNGAELVAVGAVATER